MSIFLNSSSFPHITDVGPDTLLLAATDVDAAEVNCSTGGQMPLVAHKDTTSSPTRLMFVLPVVDVDASQTLRLTYAYLDDPLSRLVRFVSLLSISATGTMCSLEKRAKETRSCVKDLVYGVSLVSVPAKLFPAHRRLVVAVELGWESGEFEFLGFTLEAENGKLLASSGRLPDLHQDFAEEVLGVPKKAPNAARKQRLATKRTKPATFIPASERNLLMNVAANTSERISSASGVVINEVESVSTESCPQRRTSLRSIATPIEQGPPFEVLEEIRTKLETIVCKMDLRELSSQPASMHQELAQLILIHEAHLKEWESERGFLLSETDTMRRALDEAESELAMLRSRDGR